MTYILAVSLTESPDVQSILPGAYIYHTACGVPLCACTCMRGSDPQQKKESKDPRLTVAPSKIITQIISKSPDGSPPCFSPQVEHLPHAEHPAAVPAAGPGRRKAMPETETEAPGS